MGRLMLLALEYKLDSVCNAERVPRYRMCSCNPMGIRTKINYKDSITLYVVDVNIFRTIYSKKTKQNKAASLAGAIYTVLLTFKISLGVQSRIRHRVTIVLTVTLLFFRKASRVPVEK